MSTHTTPDLIAQARALAARSGLSETRVLEITAGKIATELAKATNPQFIFHLSRDLEVVKRRIRELEAPR